jgi:serine/threonine-protein kinase
MTDAHGQLLAARYEILRSIGQGGCATVYEALDRKTRRHVAVKVAFAARGQEELSRRLERETRVAAALHHPNICSVTDAGRLENGTPFFVMERLFGETLRDVLRRSERLRASFALDVAAQTLSALDAAHAAGFVHRDVKPENVFLVSRRGCGPLVKLLDFGLCCPTHDAPVSDVTLTRAGAVVGTPEYMSPEQASGERRFDPRLDVYATGLVLYESLTGLRPYAGDGLRAMISKIVGGTLLPVSTVRPDLPSVLDAVLARATARDPKARYASARELLHAVFTLADRRDVRAHEPDDDPTSHDAATRPTIRIRTEPTARA